MELQLFSNLAKCYFFRGAKQLHALNDNRNKPFLSITALCHIHFMLLDTHTLVKMSLFCKGITICQLQAAETAVALLS